MCTTSWMRANSTARKKTTRKWFVRSLIIYFIFAEKEHFFFRRRRRRWLTIIDETNFRVAPHKWVWVCSRAILTTTQYTFIPFHLVKCSSYHLIPVDWRLFTFRVLMFGRVSETWSTLLFMYSRAICRRGHVGWDRCKSSMHIFTLFTKSNEKVNRNERTWHEWARRCSRWTRGHCHFARASVAYTTSSSSSQPSSRGHTPHIFATLQIFYKMRRIEFLQPNTNTNTHTQPQTHTFVAMLSWTSV